ncbi:MAG TPA: molybdopterin-binding protein [Acetobacteraceae bacterium]|nr:molybdopterin-binding protein [Acetobacteraceae bacterium]
MSPVDATGAPADVRLRGFGDRLALEEARAWLAARVAAPAQETVPLAAAVGRVLAEAVRCDADFPAGDRVAVDGYAVRAAETLGAGAYNPVLLPIASFGVPPAGTARLCAAGEALPAGMDAILPFAAAERQGPTLAVMAAVAPGEGVERRGAGIAGGTTVLASGAVLDPGRIAVLAALGRVKVTVARRPVAALIVPGPKPHGSAAGADALTPMLRALLARDGAVLRPVAAARDLLAAIREAADADLVLVAGRSGVGADDGAAAAIVAAGGGLHAHGIAMRPGDSAGIGAIARASLVLLPGEPFACFAAYDLLASGAVRAAAGLPVALPYPVVPLTLARKIVSAIGFTDFVPVAIAGDRAEPLAGGLAAVAAAAGFVLVPAAREGHAAGEIVPVHLYPCTYMSGDMMRETIRS